MYLYITHTYTDRPQFLASVKSEHQKLRRISIVREPNIRKVVLCVSRLYIGKSTYTIMLKVLLY